MISRCSFKRGCPTNSSSRLGRRLVSSAASTGSALTFSSSSRLIGPRSSAHPVHGEQAQRVPQQILDRCVVAELVQHVAYLVGRVPEARQRLAYLGARRDRDG